MVTGCLVLVSLLSGCLVSQEPMATEEVEAHIKKKKAKPTRYTVLIDAKRQSLTLMRDKKTLATYPISTSRHGLGQKINSYKTPVGLHRIVEKIGHDVPTHGIFHRRQYVGAVWQPVPREEHRKDYIVTRVLRLKGLEPGLNAGTDHRGHKVDSEERAIYIHGTTMEWLIGRPSTKGCIHMKNKDVIDLFNRVPNGTLVMVVP